MPKITSQLVFKGKDEGVTVTVRNIGKEIKQLNKNYKELSKIEKTAQAFTKEFLEQLRRQGKTLKNVGLSTVQLNRASQEYAATLHRSSASIKINENAAKALSEVQKKQIKEEKILKGSQDARRRILKGLNDKLKEHGTLLRRVVPDTELMRKAISGNVGAMKKLRLETKKYIQESKKANKSAFLGVRNFRNLSGSFSVLRSKLLLASFAFALFSRTLGKFITSASEAEEILNKFSVVFGSLSKNATDFADSLGESVGRSSVALSDMMATIQDTFVPLGFSRDVSFELSKALTQLTLDVGSFQNMADAEVMNRFQSAIVGNHEAVRRFGISITEATIKEEALRIKLIKTDRELTNQQKIIARLSLIFNGAKDATNDLLNTQDSYANVLKKFNDNIKDLSIGIGELLIPAAKAVIEPISKLVEHLKDPIVLDTYAKGLGVLAAALGVAALAAGALAAKVIVIGASIAGAIIWFTKFMDAIASFRKRGVAATSAVNRVTINYVDTLELLKDAIKRVDTEQKTLSITQNTLALKAADEMLQVETARLEILEESWKMMKDKSLAGMDDARATDEQRQKNAELYAGQEVLVGRLRTLIDNLTEQRFAMDGLGQASEDLLQKQDVLKVGFDNTGVSLDFLNSTQRGIVDGLTSMSGAMATATLNGQKMGDAVVSSLKAIAAELIANAAVYSLLNIFTGGTFGATSGGLGKFLFGGFAQHGMDEVVTQPTMIVAGEAGAERVNITPLGGSSQEQAARSNVNINISGGLIQDDYVRNELIPALNKAVSLGAELNA